MDAPVDEGSATELVAQMSADFGGALVSALAYIGDRLGIFRVLADGMHRDSLQLARETGLNERYLREWASTLVASRYLSYAPDTSAFYMTPAQAAVLADEESPFYFAGSPLYAQACVRQVPALLESFRHGGGVPFADYGPEISEAIQMLFANGYRDAVASRWIPAVTGLAESLRSGGRVAEVGCGGGRALIAVAEAFPNSKCVGLDLDATSLERATQAAAGLGMAGRVTFHQRAAEDLSGAGQFDLVMAFNCIHDMAQPVDALRGIRRALAPSGVLLWSEARASDRLEENTTPLSRNLYASSVMHCMAVSMASGGAGLGVVLGDRVVRELAAQAEFSSCDVLPVEHPFHQVYALRA